jgi:hypothetical protein
MGVPTPAGRRRVWHGGPRELHGVRPAPRTEGVAAAARTEGAATVTRTEGVAAVARTEGAAAVVRWRRAGREEWRRAAWSGWRCRRREKGDEQAALREPSEGNFWDRAREGTARRISGTERGKDRGGISGDRV